MKYAVICLLAIGAALTSRDVIAQPAAFTCPERPDKPAKARKEAGTYFSEAETAYTEERYLQALEKFCCSLVMVEHENTIINIEKTLAQIPLPEEALPVLTSTLAKMSEGPLKTRVSERVSKMESELAEQSQAEVVACPEAPVAPPPDCPPAGLLDLETEFTARGHKLLRIGGWTGVGIGAASFITAIAFQAVAGSAKNRAQEAVSYDVFLDERDKNRSFQTAATVAFVGSALTASVGIVQLLLLSEQQKQYRDRKAKEASPRSPAGTAPKVSFTPGIGRLDMEVTF